MQKGLCLLVAALLALPAFSQEKGTDKPEKKMLKPALLVIDVQTKFIPMMSEPDQKRAPEYINAYIWLFRQHNLPVIRVYHTDPDWGPAPGTEEFAFPETFNVEEGDPQVIKHYPNAFTKTCLDSLLQARECNTLFLCGLSATGCVLATYFGAYDHDYEVFMLEHALMSPDAGQTRTVEEFTDTVSWSVVNLLFGNTLNEQE